MTVNESEQLYRLDAVIAHAEQALGPRQNATKWLRRPNGALRGEIPLQLLDTDIGTNKVHDVLGRIEHGVFS